MLKAYPSYLLKSFGRFITLTGNKSKASSYSRNAFNEYGDNVYSAGHEEHFTFKASDISDPKVNDICVARINSLNATIKSCSATLLIAGYPIADGEFTQDKQRYILFENDLRERMECPVISSVSDYYFDYSLFYNAKLHLTDEGAIIRTKQFIIDLENYLARSDP